MVDAEFQELMGICNERNITPEKLLEEKVAPLQELISKSQGELIGALTRGYEQCSHGMSSIHYGLGEILYAGIITSKTRFPSKKDSVGLGDFLFGIEKSHSVRLNSGSGEDFVKRDNGIFGSWMKDYWGLLYFMDRPPQVPENSVKYGCFGIQSTAYPIEKPRLELYLGNKQTLPFLQENLEGWRYLRLSKLLGCDLSVNDELAKKIEGEQLELFDKMRETSGDKFLSLLRTAIKRGYHEIGGVVQREIDAGVIMQINLKEFFSQKKLCLDYENKSS